MRTTITRADDETVNWRSSIPFLAVHLVPLLAVLTGVTRKAVAICVVLYAVRMVAITAGYHRYFSHRSYNANRVVQFVLAFAGTTAAQKGPLWWASHHRAHHRYSDTILDVHSPQKGFWWSHVGWFLSDKYSATDYEAVADLARYPELRFLNRFDAIGPWALGIAAFLVGGWSGLVIGFFLSTVLLWHATFTVNSLNHVLGHRRYATPDTSKNNAFLAVLTSGEGWHNNHHHFPASARQGFFWWEIDTTWYVLRALAAVRLISGLRQPTPAVRANGRVRDGAFDLGMFRVNWARARAAVLKSTAASLRHKRPDSAEWTELDDKRAALEGCIAESLMAAEDLVRSARRERVAAGRAEA